MVINQLQKFFLSEFEFFVWVNNVRFLNIVYVFWVQGRVIEIKINNFIVK